MNNTDWADHNFKPWNALRFADYRALPLRWNAAAEKAGKRQRVSCTLRYDAHSEWLNVLQELVPQTPHLDWVVTTGNIGVLRAWDFVSYPNLWAGIVVPDQFCADLGIPELVKLPSAVRFVICAPLLEHIDLTRWLEPTGIHCMDVCPDQHYINPDEYTRTPGGDPICPNCGLAATWTGYDNRIDWVIAGGATGRGARPTHPKWAESLRDQCTTTNVPFRWWRWGEYVPYAAKGSAEFDKSPDVWVCPDTGEIIKDINDPRLNTGWRGLWKADKMRPDRFLGGRTWDESPVT